MLTHRHSTSDAILSFLVIFAPAGFDTIGLDPGIGLVGSLHAELLLRECGSYSVCLFSTFFGHSFTLGYVQGH